MSVTVSQLNAYVKQSLLMDAVLNDIVVEGDAQVRVAFFKKRHPVIGEI